MRFAPKPWMLRHLNLLFLLPLVVHPSHALQSPAKDSVPLAQFLDVAEKSGLTMSNTFGGKDAKKYIIETTGTGVAIFDYDNDGWPDIFLINGTTLEGQENS